MNRALAVVIGVALSAFCEAAGGTTIWKADKNLLRRFERELCPLLDDGINTIHWQRFQVVKAMGEPGRQTLLHMAETRGKVGTWERQCAVGFLAELREERAKPVLRRLVEDDSESDDLRANAVAALTAAFGDIEALPKITAIVLQRRHSQDILFGRALTALADVDDDRARATLRELLTDPSVPEGTISGVLSSIGIQRDREAIPLLVAMGGSGDDRRQWEVALSLGRIGTREGLMAARDILVRMKESRWKVSAAEEILTALKGHRQRSPDAGELAAIEGLAAVAQRIVSEAPPFP